MLPPTGVDVDECCATYHVNECCSHVSKSATSPNATTHRVVHIPTNLEIPGKKEDESCKCLGVRSVSRIDSVQGRPFFNGFSLTVGVNRFNSIKVWPPLLGLRR